MALKQKHQTPNHPDLNNPTLFQQVCIWVPFSVDLRVSRSPEGSRARLAGLSALGDSAYWEPSLTVRPPTVSPPPWWAPPQSEPLPHNESLLLSDLAVLSTLGSLPLFISPPGQKAVAHLGGDARISLVFQLQTDFGLLQGTFTVFVDVWILASQLVRPFVGLFYYLLEVWIILGVPLAHLQRNSCLCETLKTSMSRGQ